MSKPGSEPRLVAPESDRFMCLADQETIVFYKHDMDEHTHTVNLMLLHCNKPDRPVLVASKSHEIRPRTFPFTTPMFAGSGPERNVLYLCSEAQATIPDIGKATDLRIFELKLP